MPRTKKTQEESVDSRRGYGEGQLYQRANGSWYARASLGYDANGKRIRPLYTGKTQAEVKRKMRDALQAKDKGLPFTDTALTVKAYLEDWINIKQNSTLRQKTKKSYEQIVRCHLVPGLGSYKLTQLDAMTVEKFINGKIASGLSTQTAIYIRRVLHSALGDAVAYDKVVRNVAALTKPPKASETEKRVFTAEQAQQLLAAFAENHHGTLFTTILGLGLRLGEGLGLRWIDLELDCPKPHVRLQVQLQFLDGQYQLTQPKSKASRRTVYLPYIVTRALRDHKKHQAEMMQTLAGEAWSNAFGLVFTNSHGGPLDDANIRRTFYKLLENHSIPKVRLHDLRHMCGSLLVSRGVHTRVVQELLGHSSYNITMDRYVHVNPRDIASAAEAMDQTLGDGR